MTTRHPIEERLRPWSRGILAAAGAASAATVIFAAGRSELYYATMGMGLAYGLAPMAAAGTCAAAAFAGAGTQLRAATLVLAMASGACLIETALALGIASVWPRHGLGAREMAASRGVAWDQRTDSEALAALKSRGVDAFPLVLSRYLWPTDGFGTSGRPLLPLGGPSRATMQICNEEGFHALYRTDERGFKNPRGLHGKPAALVILGDSVTDGFCVPQGEDVASRVRREVPATLTLGQGGAGPLQQLATLTEYARPLRPRFVIWCFSPNDFDDLALERRSPTLSRYLSDPSFSQHLAARQPEIDAGWRAWLARITAARGPWPGNPPKTDPPRAGPATLAARVARLYHLRVALQENVLMESHPLNAGDWNQLERYAGLVSEARRRASAWGGRFYFVYVPGWNFFVSPRLADRFHRPLKDRVRRLGIPVIDLVEEIRKHPDPLSLFPYRIHGHYNAAGQRYTAEVLLRVLRQTAAGGRAEGRGP